MPTFQDGFIIVAKRECPTCELLEPVYAELAAGEAALSVFSQDDPAFPESLDDVIDDTGLENSYRLDVETVPTLIRWKDGREVERAIGWNKTEWRDLTGVNGLGGDLPENQPGCGSITVEPGMPEKLAVRFGDTNLNARRIEVAAMEDDIEVGFERGWSDGLPVVPPTEVRVVRMLTGTTRDPSEIIGNVPPNLAPC
ncbi:MAG: thioredoxin, partial [Rhodospirillaceae bacterium]|nr:thioredoxin [Rhodospirillaceae bacterium]